MSDIVLGTMPDASASRDAIHVAIIPQVAERDLHPGERLAYGIVDPYLTHKVMAGERFWLCLYPQTVTGMRHHWSHTAFDNQEPVVAMSDKTTSEMWLLEFCRSNDCPPYEIIIRSLRGENISPDGDHDAYYRMEIDDEYFFFGGYHAHSVIPEEFWHHIEVVLGHNVSHKPPYFSCSC